MNSSGSPKQEISKSVMLSARFTEAEAEDIAKAISRSAQPKTAWIQKTLLEAARRN